MGVCHYQGGIKTCEKCGKMIKNIIGHRYCESCNEKINLAKKEFIDSLRIRNEHQFGKLET